MRDWCKHRYGFINMDDECLYFTSSGNWSDTKELSEFNEEKSRLKSSGEKWKITIYLIVIGSILAFVIWRNISQGFDPFLLLVIVGVALSVYKYMSPSLHEKFKLPYSKLRSMEIGDTHVMLIFLDFNGNEITQTIDKLDHKACQLFAEISDSYQLTPKKPDSENQNTWEI